MIVIGLIVKRQFMEKTKRMTEKYVLLVASVIEDTD